MDLESIIDHMCNSDGPPVYAKDNVVFDDGLKLECKSRYEADQIVQRVNACRAGVTPVAYEGAGVLFWILIAITGALLWWALYYLRA